MWVDSITSSLFNAIKLLHLLNNIIYYIGRPTCAVGGTFLGLFFPNNIYNRIITATNNIQIID